MVGDIAVAEVLGFCCKWQIAVVQSFGSSLQVRGRTTVYALYVSRKILADLIFLTVKGRNISAILQ